MPESLAQNARINSLPPELLSLIFITVVDSSLYARSVNDDSYGSTDYPILLSSVCILWRRIANSIPDIWSYIDFDPNDSSLHSLDRAKLYLERSRSSPLHMHIGKFHEVSGDDHTGRFDGPPGSLDETVAYLLRLNAPRLNSLALNYSHRSFVGDTVSILHSQGTENPLRKLALRRVSATRSRAGIPPQERLDQLLKPLHGLYLENVPRELIGTSCCNLVELHLIHIAGKITSEELVGLLNSNPSLRIIKIHGVDLNPRRPSSQPIDLPDLRRIELNIDEVFMNWFLAFLVPGSHELDLHLHTTSLQQVNEPNIRRTIISFFQRTRVKYLFLLGKWLLLPPILAYLPHLQSLGLSVYDVDSSTLAGIEQTVNTLVKLHNIDMIECNLANYSVLDPGLRILLTLPSIQRVRHFKCGNGRLPGARQRFRDLLLKNGVATQGTDSPELNFEVHPSPFR
jgi:hypothetical protein